ncbi:ComF family protein [Pararhodobacter sp.]|uniref:ComF family protein n=1 Tax=Pararhodobacter sp. TaxID=2127056 RepID=UPI002AFE24C3|nr:ComF family protein [Pararhodobacter sp.]
MGSVFRLTAAEVKSTRAGSLLIAGARGLLDTLYPPHCLACDVAVQDPGTLCAACWSDTPFVSGLACDKCGIPLLGNADEGEALCDDCLTVARPWAHGRAALVYGDVARRMVLALKYGDRHDIATPAGRWMARRLSPLIRPDTVVVPVPLHRWRLFKRRYNQSALLAAALARDINRPHCPDLLLRTRRTTTQDGRTRAGRFENLQGAIAAHPKRAHQIEGRHVVLVDDVMTSGATLAAATEACFGAGADTVDVVVMARVGREE